MKKYLDTISAPERTLLLARHRLGELVVWHLLGRFRATRYPQIAAQVCRIAEANGSVGPDGSRVVPTRYVVRVPAGLFHLQAEVWGDRAAAQIATLASDRLARHGARPRLVVRIEPDDALRDEIVVGRPLRRTEPTGHDARDQRAGAAPRGVGPANSAPRLQRVIDTQPVTVPSVLGHDDDDADDAGLVTSLHSRLAAAWDELDRIGDVEVVAASSQIGLAHLRASRAAARGPVADAGAYDLRTHLARAREALRRSR